MDDRKIVALFWQRDERAIMEFECEYKRLCLTIARESTGSPETAEECYNDTCLRLWNAIPPEKPRSLKAYAIKIVRNLALSRYEKEHTAKRSAILVELDETLSEELPDLETGEITAIINEFLSIIEPNEAKIFVRRYFYSEAVGDIAKVYGIKENKVSKILLKTRKTLRTYLAERGIHV